MEFPFRYYFMTSLHTENLTGSHIRAPNETISDHGDRAESAVFYIDAIEASGEPPRLIWRDSTHLVISYDGRMSSGNGPGKAITNIHGISIEYHPVPRK
jgi:hypothetical protein